MKLIQLIDNDGEILGLYDVSKANIDSDNFQEAFEDMIEQDYDTRDDYMENKYGIVRVFIYDEIYLKD
jgi:hypothetical protein